MRRNMDLLRKLLMTVEDGPHGDAPDNIKIEGYTEEEIGYHSYLLVDAGLARGIDVASNQSPSPEWQLRYLTWAGHEFCEAARDETRWKKAMRTIGDKGGTATLEIITALLVGYMKTAFGIPG